MKEYKAELLFILLILFGSFGKIISQCNQTQIISICDMTTIDFDTDGNPDGIINLYAETGTTPIDGVWSIAPRFAAAFDSLTGDLSLWALQNSTTEDSQNDYLFELRNVNCEPDPVRTATLIVGPYSGVALPPGSNDANTEICDNEVLDLFEVLASEATIPPPHINGRWEFIGSSSGADFEGTFELEFGGSLFSAEVPYDQGLPLVDREVFEFKYTVPGFTPCAPSQETIIKVSVVRAVDAGSGSTIRICEDDLKAGLYDADINLRDDQYLRDEDIEGIWMADLDTTGEIEDEQDSVINLRKIYDDLIDNGNNIRFGCETYDFTYRVISRSPVCPSSSATVRFVFYEELRPFSQEVAPPEICKNEEPGDINLFDLITFSEENGEDFIYTNIAAVDWRLVSGASNLGLKRVGEPGFSHLGTVNTFGKEPGIYIFEYGVHSSINCSVSCNPFSPAVDENDICFPLCDVLTAQVTIEILPFDYPGEDTTDLNLCETQESVDLRSLLRTNGVDTIVTTGVWTNSSGDIVDNTFVFPEIDNEQTFTFTYSTVSIDGCTESANLSFTIFKEANAGSGTVISLCSDNLTVTLFDLLEGDPNPIGGWTGPFGYTSPNHLGVFDALDTTLPILGPGDYVYTVMANVGCLGTDQATVTISIVEPVEIGNDRSDSFCEIDGRVNLFTILDNDTPRIGSFQDIENTGALTPEGVVEFDLLPNPDNEINKIYNFRYVIPNTAPCDESALNVEVQIIDLPEPNVPDQEFCILDAKRLDDIEVDVLNYNWYPTLESDMPIIDNPLLVDNQIYYIATVDTDNCESERVTVAINILNIGERFSNGDVCSLDFQDGVSPDGNNQNDTFDLFIEDEFNIPVAFPDFNLKIYNRYGATVFEGNRNTEEFRGESNVSIRLGDDLPSGTYFYIFTPNFENNFPIQGSFYLSR
ncbi:gliding motility-associated C-terminal domain-containing protein [uncultured Aquimarina sp.]|uniref:T9SS type B sorting domain-containing protein n=1 Tax=uncultured Aquimarina sp. TaxID=575652 RepID=UPI00263648FA|nr:gliding motility-associated C-terminal domain-containing protein [uncultured Aquimarina sp.]